MLHGGVPSSWNCVTSPTQKSSLLSNGTIAAVSATSTQIERYTGSGTACSQCDASCTDSIVTMCGPIEWNVYFGTFSFQSFSSSLSDSR